MKKKVASNHTKLGQALIKGMKEAVSFQKVKRFRCTDAGSSYGNYGEPVMAEDASGSYVLAKDYDLLKKRIREAEGVISFYADEKSFSGEKARSYLKKNGRNK